MKKLFCIILAFFCQYPIFAQSYNSSADYKIWGVASIGKGSNSPTSSDALLELGLPGTNKGVLLPRVLDTSTIGNPGFGMFVYSISQRAICYHDGTTWHVAMSSVDADARYKLSTYVPSWGEITGKPATFAPSAHTHTLSDVTGLQTALNLKADKTTSIIAGTGLTGGGDLSANRTIAANFGTAAGTIAQGNDSRINNGQTAFSWGNHASAGYLTTTTGDARYPQLAGFYSNPNWITSLAWSKITGVPSFAPANIPLSTVLTNGNIGTTSIFLSGNGAASSFTSMYTTGSNTTTAGYSNSGDGVQLYSLAPSGPEQTKLDMQYNATTPLFSHTDAGGGFTSYGLWHQGNHPAGIATNNTLSGATVFATLNFNSAGHYIGATTRSLSPSDIGAAPVTGSANYIQNQVSVVQPGAGFWTAGAGTAGVFRSLSPVASTGGDFGFYEGTNIASANLRWRLIRTNTEGAGNAGNDFNLQSFTNTGTLLATPFSVNTFSNS